MLENKSAVAFTGFCCPHCSLPKSKMRKLVFTRNSYNCPQCGRTVAADRLRLVEEYVTAAHWSRRMPLVNPDKMEYKRGIPNPGCIFDHRKERMVDVATGKASKREPLKVYKRG